MGLITGKPEPFAFCNSLLDSTAPNPRMARNPGIPSHPHS